MQLDTDSDADTETPERRAGRGGLHVFRLLLVHSPDTARTGEVHLLSQLPLIIGRARHVRHEGGLPLTDSRVSRRHACIELSDRGIRIRDLGSSNGTFVNGQARDTADLTNGDVVRVGSHLFVVQALDEHTCRSLVERHRLFPNLWGHSPHLKRVMRDIERFAPTNHPVLILGETGVGKELVAHALHEASQRRGPFVPVNCGALPPNLIESELFGHEAGAFTGASQARSGLFDEADGGTILLDEIGDMPPALQVSLLRVLATGEVRRVGGRRPRRVDARVIAATHVDLAAGVERGSFRGDLYARLRAAVIHVPPLRQRRDDILLLASRFLSRARSPLTLSADAAEALLIYDWPFNVRELEQVATTAASAVLGGEVIDLEHLPDFLRPEMDDRDASVEIITGMELSEVCEAGPSWADAVDVLRVARTRKPSARDLECVLRFYKGNVAHVAAYFSKDRRQIYRWCRQLRLDPRAIRAEATNSSPDAASSSRLEG